MGPVGYLELLRSNRSYRRIWLGALVSLTGDWFTTIALFAQLLELTGKGEALGLALIARFVPSVVLGPAAGVIADRFDRKRVMVICDLLRAVVVLGFIFVRTKEDVPIVYLLTLIQTSLSAIFEPCENAAIGSVVAPNEVVTANTIQSMTWSAMLSLGAVLGGIVTAAVGRDAAFVIDALTYVASALLIASARMPHQRKRSGRSSFAEAMGVRDFVEGIALLKKDARVRVVLWAKASFGLAGGGAFLMYSVFAERVFPIGSTAAGIGVLYGARGIGALLGPYLARRVGGDSEAWLEKVIRGSFALIMCSYAAFALSPMLWQGAIALLVAHMGASIVWTFTNALITMRVPDAMRGRVFAADMSLFTIALSISTYTAGVALDQLAIAPRQLMLAIAFAMILPVITWRGSPRAVMTATT
jgi:MFS family permease